MSDKLKELAKPFPAEYIEWRPGATTRDKTSALALAYVDPRRYQDRLNEVFGLGWSDSRKIYFASGKVITEVTIMVKDSDTVTSRSGVGEEFMENATLGSRKVSGNENAVTGADAQAFKRACVELGLGAYLYSWGNIWAEFDKGSKRFTRKGMSKLNQEAHNLTEQALRAWRGESSTEKKKPERKAPQKKAPPKKKVSDDKAGTGPKATKIWLLSEAEKRDQRPLSIKDTNQIVPLLNNILGGEEARKVWLEWTYGDDSSKNLTGAQKDVLWETMRPTYDNKVWSPTGDKGQRLAVAIKEMYQEALKEKDNV